MIKLDYKNKYLKKKSVWNRELSEKAWIICFAVILACMGFTYFFLINTTQSDKSLNLDTVVTQNEPKTEPNEFERGIASFYDYDLDRVDQKCLDDNCYSMSHLTCASRDYKRGTILKVTNLDNGKTTTCRVNDYGPEDLKRLIDLSSYAFGKIGNFKHGLIRVEITEK